MSGSTNYPTGLDDDTSLLDVTDGVTPLIAVHHNNTKEAVKALEVRVGIIDTSDPDALDFRLGNPTSGHSHDGTPGQGVLIDLSTAKKALPWITVAPDGWAGGTPDYQCDGVNDEVEIQAALDASAAFTDDVPVLLLPGEFNIGASPITLQGRQTLEGVGYTNGLALESNGPSVFRTLLTFDLLPSTDAPFVVFADSGAVLRNLKIDSPQSGDEVLIDGGGNDNLIENVQLTTQGSGDDNYAIDGGAGATGFVVRNVWHRSLTSSGSWTIRADFSYDSTITGASVNSFIHRSDAAQLGMPHGNGVPSGSPASNRWWSNQYKDDTAVTGGLYHWDGSGWVKDTVIL